MDDLARILQVSITPVALISAVGLLLLSMTNRFARTIDRARILAREMREAPENERTNLEAQIRVLYRRSRILRASITLACVSALCASLIIVCLFGIYATDLSLRGMIVGLFILCIGSLVASQVLFINDLSLALKALKHEIKDCLK